MNALLRHTNTFFALANFLLLGLAIGLNGAVDMDGDFERSHPSGWNADGDASLSTDDTLPFSGSRSLLISDRAASWQGALRDLRKFTKNGMTYSLSAWVRIQQSDAPQFIEIKIDQNDANGFNGSQSIGSVYTFDSQWRRIQGTFTRSTKGSVSQFSLKILGPDAGVDVWLDDVSIQEYDPIPRDVEVTVDFATTNPSGNLSGYLYGFLNDAPANSMIEPLRPVFWRGANRGAITEFRQRVEGNGARAVWLVSEGWGYPADGRTSPWDDWSAFEANVRSQVQTNGSDVIYDIWNEPDAEMFFTGWEGGDFTQFLEVFQRAHDVIRAELGTEAQISGPSLAHSDYDRIRRFMDYCLENGLQLDVLSLHFLGTYDWETSQMRDYIQQIRSEFIESRRYSPVGVRQLHVNEYLMTPEADLAAGRPAQAYRPGSILSHLYHLESGEVDGAMRACWGHPDDITVSTCFDGSLDGLLTRVTKKPRPAWWTYALYAAGQDSRVASSTSSDNVVALASRRSDEPGRSQVLIGNFPGSLPHGPRAIQVKLQNLGSLPFLPRNPNAVRVYARRIPLGNNGVEALAAPVNFMDPSILSVWDGEAVVTLPPLPLYDAAVLFIEPIDG